MAEKMCKHRLKKEELIFNIFAFFSEKYDSEFNNTIFDINIPIEEIENYLEKKYDIQYTSNTWIFTQIKRYEAFLGVNLFQKNKSFENPDSFTLSIYKKMSSFSQFQHLYLTQKLKIANGAYDQIINSIREKERAKPINILLGAGTINYHLADIIAEKTKELKLHFNIYTHNFGIMNNLMSPEKISQYLQIYSPSGVIDPVGHTIIGNDNALYLQTEFRFIVQTTNSIFERKLYVHTEKEGIRKQVILKNCKGIKILALVMDEFKNHIENSMFNYGNLSDYDYIVIPRTRGNRKHEYEIILNKMNDLIYPEIIHWNYIIYKVNKD